MLKVRLKKNLRSFHYDDTHFELLNDQIKELPDHYLKSYSIKLYLFSGRMEVLDGEANFRYKNSNIFIDKDGLYGKEFGKYFTKNLEYDELMFIERSKVPQKALNVLDDLKVEEVKVEKPKEEVKVEKPKEEKKPVKKPTVKKVKKTEEIKKE